MLSNLRIFFISSLVSGLLGTTLQAASLNISNVPLYLGGGIAPNVIFTLDDSGSMQWEFMPDDNYTYYLYPVPEDVYGADTFSNFIPAFEDTSYSSRVRSSDINAIYYNPAITYIPWARADGSSMGPVSPSCAPHNPYQPGLGCRDLTEENRERANWESYNGGQHSFPDDLTVSWNDRQSFWPAVYYRFDGGNSWNAANYTKFEIRPGNNYPRAANRSDCLSQSYCTYQEEIQNFANWYSYYRSRILAARAGIGLAFSRQGSGLRVGFARINQDDAEIDDVDSNGTMVRGVRAFTGSDRDQFFSLLYGTEIDLRGTPLRRSIKQVGEYLQRDDQFGPWSEIPGTNDDQPQLTCRQNYNILMTDGYWNGSSPSEGNADNQTGTRHTNTDGTSYQYTPSNPYRDQWSDTLADVAMEFWKEDLRPDMRNNVPANDEDPAFWQHLVNYTIGLGVNGRLNPATDLSVLSSGSLNWPEPGDDKIENIDDLWHAAINSRGRYFNATEPGAFTSALDGILTNISSRSGSSSSVAINSSTVSSQSRIYQARYESGDWTGDLIAFGLSSNNFPVEQWRASDLISGPDKRNIFTFDGNEGQPFLWDSLSSQQQSLLGSEPVLEYLRGEISNEQRNGGSFRNRGSLLGDIINSSPIFYAGPSQRYPDSWGADSPENTSPYSSFVSRYFNRQPVIYVGANDGMLHAFNADTGQELFAYVPESIFPQLPLLADPSYGHRFYVDGTPTIVDAFINGQWRSILLSGLRSGGQGIFALDVTEPESFDSDNILWEFTDSDDRDLGFTFGKPSIARLHNGDWAAIFSGGYNNTVDNGLDGGSEDSNTGNAVLYIVNLADGQLIKKIDTGVGSDEDPTGQNRPNGLSTPAVVDYNSDGIADIIYAGDLFGNLWKVDITSENNNQWDISLKQGNTPLPLFQACSADSASPPVNPPSPAPPSITVDDPGTWNDSGRDVRTFDDDTRVRLTPDERERVTTTSAEFTLNDSCDVSITINFDDARDDDRVNVTLDNNHYAEIRRDDGDWELRSRDTQNASWDEDTGLLTFTNVSAGSYEMSVSAYARNNSDDFEATFSDLFASCLGTGSTEESSSDINWQDTGRDVDVSNDGSEVTLTPDEDEAVDTESNTFTIASECSVVLNTEFSGSERGDRLIIRLDGDHFAELEKQWQRIRGDWTLDWFVEDSEGADWDRDSGTLSFNAVTPGSYRLEVEAIADDDNDGGFDVSISGSPTNCSDDNDNDNGGGNGGIGSDDDAACAANNRQPITTQPQVTRHPTGLGFMVLFGTGKYFEVGDNTPDNQLTQSFYGLWDNTADDATLTRSDLLQQSILSETVQSSYEVRVTSDNNIDWTQHKGWFMDLFSPASDNNEGERQVSKALIRNGRIIFTTLLPSEDQCEYGGSGWLMELNAYSGSRLPYSPFDLNGDRVFDTSDYATLTQTNDQGESETSEVPVSGKKSKVGIIPTPAVVTTEDGTAELKYTSGSTGNIEVTTENPGPGITGRQSWRKLQLLPRRN